MPNEEDVRILTSQCLEKDGVRSLNLDGCLRYSSKCKNQHIFKMITLKKFQIIDISKNN